MLPLHESTRCFGFSLVCLGTSLLVNIGSAMEAALKDKADETMDANAAAVDMAALIAASASPNGPSSGVCVVCTAAFCNEDFKSKYCN